MKWCLGVRELIATNLCERPRILLENANNDGGMFEEIFKRESKRVGAGPLCYYFVNGGGATTYQEFARLCNDGYTVVCICDHDRIAPFTKKSETLRRVYQEANGRTFIGSVSETPCREIENFIPLKILESMFSNICQSDINQVHQLIQAQGDIASGDCLWLYFDIKEGCKPESIRGKCLNDQSKEWIARKYNIADISELTSICGGFGQNVVTEFLSSPEALKSFHSFSRSNYWKTHFSHWIGEVIGYFTASSPTRL